MPSISIVEALHIIENSEDNILRGIRWLEEGMTCFVGSTFPTEATENWDITLSRTLAFNIQSSREAMRSILLSQLENIRARRESRTPPWDDYSALMASYKASYDLLYDIMVLWQRIQSLQPRYERYLPPALRQVMKNRLPDLEKVISFCKETHETIAQRFRIWNGLFEVALTEAGLLLTLHHLDDHEGGVAFFSQLVTPAFKRLQKLRDDRHGIETECAVLKADLIQEWLLVKAGRLTVEAVQRATAGLESYHCEVLSQQVIQDQAMKSIANAVKAALDLTLAIRASDSCMIPTELDLQVLSDECEDLKTSVEEVTEMANNTRGILKELVDTLEQASQCSSAL